MTLRWVLFGTTKRVHVSLLITMESLFATDNLLLIIIPSSLLGIVIMIVIMRYVIGGKKAKEAEKSPEPSGEDRGEDEAPEDNAVEERRPKKSKQFARKPSYSHASLTASLKGHTGEILEIDFDSRGKYLLSCSEGNTA